MASRCAWTRVSRSRICPPSGVRWWGGFQCDEDHWHGESIVKRTGLKRSAPREGAGRDCSGFTAIRRVGHQSRRHAAEWKTPPQPDARRAVYAARIVLDLIAGYAACVRTGHGTGHGSRVAEIAEAEDCDPEGVPAFLRELAYWKIWRRLRPCCKGKKVAPGREVVSGRGQQVGAGRGGTARRLADDCLTRARILCRPAAGPASASESGLLEPGEVGISATNRNFKGRMGSRDAKCYLASAGGSGGVGGCRVHSRPLQRWPNRTSGDAVYEELS